MNTEELIAQLAQQTAPVKRLPSPHRRLAVWLAWVVPVLLAIVLVMGVRADLSARMADPAFALQHMAAAATGLCAAWAALASTVPGISRWRLALPVPPALVWLASIGIGCLREWAEWGADSLLPAIHPRCLDEIALISVIPLAALVALVRRGASFQPRLTGILTALAAAATGSAALDLFHPAEAAIIVLVWHFMGITVLSLLFGLVGRRLFRI